MTRRIKNDRPLEKLIQDYKIQKYSDKKLKKLKVLGRGAFGKVYLAYGEDFGFLAIKEINLEEKEDFRNVLYEYEILRKIETTKNLNFLKFHGFFKKNEMEYVIEMASGEIDLRTLIEIRKNWEQPYNNEEICYIFQFLAKQYEFLERKRIVHSDIKPQNVIIAKNTEDKGEFIYCIADFGTSFLLEKNEKMINCNDLSGFTPKYAAPEILAIESGGNKFKCYDPYAADVYSLGGLVLDLLGVRKKSFLNNHYDPNKVLFEKIF